MASVSKRRWNKPDGTVGERWIVRYVEASGAHRQKSFDKKKDADRHRQEIEAQLASGILAPNAVATTIAKLADDWLEMRERMHREGLLARSSLERDRYQAINQVARFLGKVKVSELRPADVDAFIADLRKWENIHLPGKMAASTVRHIVRTLAAMLDYAKRRGLVGVNVAREVLAWPEHRSGQKTPVRTFTVDQMRRLLQAVEVRKRNQTQRSADMSRAVIYLGAFCGLRCGEILGLTLHNIDWDRRVIRVRHSMDHWDNLKSPKSKAGNRDVPTPDQVAAALQRWMPNMVANERNLVFTTKAGKRMIQEPFYRGLWRPVLAAAGFSEPDGLGRRFHFHALRHFFASMMVEARLPGADVARLCGHAEFDHVAHLHALNVRGGLPLFGA